MYVWIHVCVLRFASALQLFFFWRSVFLWLYVTPKGVHRWGRVRFVLDPDPTRTILVGENQNRNIPVLMVRSSSLGPSVFRFVPVGFEFRHRCRNFVRSGEIWPIFGWIHWIWTRSRWNIAKSHRIWWISSTSLSEKQKYRRYLYFLLENLWMSRGSGGFQVDLRWKSKNIAGICHFLSENLWMSPDVVEVMVRLGGSGF